MKKAPEWVSTIFVVYVIGSVWYPFAAFIYSDSFEIGYWPYPVVKYAIAGLLLVFGALMTWAAMTIDKPKSSSKP